MDLTDEQKMLARICQELNLGDDALQSIADEIVGDAGHDLHDVQGADILMALADGPETRWYDIVWGINETLTGYQREYGGQQVSPRHSFKFFACALLMGVGARRGQRHLLEFAFDKLLVLLTTTIGVVDGEHRLDAMELMLR